MSAPARANETQSKHFHLKNEYGDEPTNSISEKAISPARNSTTGSRPNRRFAASKRKPSRKTDFSPRHVGGGEKKKDQWCGCCPCRSHAYREDEGGQKIEAANADVWSSLAAPFITTAHFGRQHESGADIGLGGFGGTVARTGDLLHCALAGTILATISIAPDLASRSFSVPNSTITTTSGPFFRLHLLRTPSFATAGITSDEAGLLEYASNENS